MATTFSEAFAWGRNGDYYSSPKYQYTTAGGIPAVANYAYSNKGGRVTAIACAGAGGKNVNFGGERLPVFLSTYAVAQTFPGSYYIWEDEGSAMAISSARVVASDVFVNNPFAPIGALVEGNLILSLDGRIKVNSLSADDYGTVNLFMIVATAHSRSTGEANVLENSEMIDTRTDGPLYGVFNLSPHQISEELTFPITFQNGGYNLLDVYLEIRTESWGEHILDENTYSTHNTLAAADFYHTLKFPTDRLAFDLSSEYTISSESLHIVDGRYIGPDIQVNSVPLPPSLVLLASGLVALCFQIRSAGKVR